MQISELMKVAEGLGFIRRYFELEIEEGDQRAHRALEHLNIIESGFNTARGDCQQLENRILNAKQVLG